MNETKKKTRVGVVVSNKMDKTVVVQVTRRLRHPVYGKVVKKKPKFYAHDEKNQCTAGDTVKIEETRPLSKQKRWRVIEIVRKAE
jgi:small subunit ribosomal protein S17